MIDILKDGNPIYRPLEIESSISSDGEITVQAYNSSNGEIANVGVYIGAAKNLGEGSLPADFSPHVDYNNLLEWGNKSLREGGYGGLILVRPNESDIYFSSKNGGSRSKKIRLGNLGAGDSITFNLRLETPSSVSSRRLYVSVNVE